MKRVKKIFISLLFVLTGTLCYGQNVPLGIFYQAVARDNFGKEIASRNIDVKFSIIKENPLGSVVYQELHSHVTTSKYGVFSLIIGKGTPSGGTFGELSQVDWSSSYHYLKIEVKFENDFIDMGTMQFLAVPYALYAQKSLEPGPKGPKGDTGPQGAQGIQGLKGDRGDPATDDQTLSFDGKNLSLSGGNTINLSTLIIPHQLSILGDTLSIMGGNKVSLTNQIQDLQLDVNNKLKISKNLTATEIDLSRFLDDKQTLAFNSVDNTLNISGGNTVNLTPIKQDLQLTGNTLSITNKATPAQVDLSPYLQSMNFTPADNKLYISGVAAPVDLTSLKDDADADPLNEIQDLNLTANKLKITNNASATEINLAPYLDNTDNQAISYNASTNTISLTNGGSANLGSMVAFRAEKTNPVGSTGPEVTMIFDVLSYNDGSAYNNTTGEFKAPIDGLYTFDVRYDADLGAKILIYLNGFLYEKIAEAISSSGAVYRSITMKLQLNNTVKVVVNTGMASQTGTGSFSGFRVY